MIKKQLNSLALGQIGCFLSVYTVAGVILALGAWVSIGRVGSVSPTSFYEGNLDSITAVVIGGTSLFGGRGSIVGALFGALIVGCLAQGLSIAGLDVLWQRFALGLSYYYSSWNRSMD
jgi:fructose transport system permease protein